MFCTYCNCNVSKDSTKCPNCGNELTDATKTLNPRPQFVVDNSTPLLGEVITNIEDLQETIVGQPAEVREESVIQLNEEDYHATTNDETTVQLNSSTVEETVILPDDKPKSNIYDFSAAVIQEPAITPLPDEISAENNTEPTTEGISKRKPIIPFIILLFIIIIVFVYILLSKDSNKKDSNSDNIIKDTTIATAQDVELVTTETSLADLETEIIAEPTQSIIIEETVVEPVSIESVSVTDSETVVTKSVYELSSDEARNYIDKQEALFQLDDGSIQDVCYVKSAYRYHYEGYYQYGVYHEDKLLVFTITDDVVTETADRYAWEYFKEMGVE